MEPPASTPHTSLSAEIKTRAILGTMLTLSIESYTEKNRQFYDTNQPLLWLHPLPQITTLVKWTEYPQFSDSYLTSKHLLLGQTMLTP